MFNLSIPFDKSDPDWKDDRMNLTGKLLIAMPGMGDPRFEHSVVFICDHNRKGAMGLIVNKPAQDVRLADLFEQLSIEAEAPSGDEPVYFGGPVEGSRGFVLHTGDYSSKIQSLAISDQFCMTATLDVLEDIAGGHGPERSLMMLGYAGWGPRQLEAEIASNGWLTTEADAELVYDLDDSEKWGAALKSLGVDPLSLSAAAGHA